VSAAAQALLAELRRLGVEVVATGDRLRFKPPSGVTPELRERMREHKGALLDLVRNAPTSPPEPSPRRAAGELEAVRNRLSALLQGRLWKDSAGWWPKDTGLSPSHAERVANAAMETAPATALPEPGPMTTARGAVAVRAWRQVVACLIAELSWSEDRAGGAAALVVDPCFPLAPPPEERDEDGYTEFDRMFEAYIERQRERFS
jgi:hypothetical protein